MKNHYLGRGKRFILVLCAFFLTKFSFCQTIDPRFKDGAVVIKFKQEFLNNIIDEAGKINYKAIPLLSAIIDQYKVTKIGRIYQSKLFEELKGFVKLDFTDFKNIDLLLSQLNQLPFIEYAEKVGLSYSAFSPNDTKYVQDSLWHLKKINAAQTWDITLGDPKIIIGLCDEGVEVTHSDLKNKIWVNKGEIAGNGIDDDNNGYIDDVNGWDFGQNDNNVNPNAGSFHGTLTSGLVGAETNNNNGVASIGNKVTVMMAKNTTTQNYIIGSDIYEGIVYLAQNGARVINLSLTSNTPFQAEQDVITALRKNGIIFVAAAGNNGSSGNADNWPCTYTGVFCVANTNVSDVKDPSSFYGTQVDISAPGTKLISTGPNNGYIKKTGTSLSSPIVAGLCGLILSINPTLSPDQVENCIKSTAVNINNLNPSYVGKMGAGRIDAFAAVNCAKATLQQTPIAKFNTISNACSANVTFVDKSSNFPTSWVWDFGDGNTSTLSSPVHSYSTNGIFTVKLTATNVNGSNTFTQTNAVSITPFDIPTVNIQSKCNVNTFTLTATPKSNGTIAWYDTPSGGIALASGNVYNTNVTTTKTLYAEETVTYPLVQGGLSVNAGGGANYNASDERKLIFNVLDFVTLKTVTINASTDGSRVIQVLDSANQPVATKLVNVPAGKTKVILDFDLSPGTGYSIKIAGSDIDLTRNSSGVLYPYNIGSLVSITTSDLGNQYYYFFYDWEVQKKPCVSIRNKKVITYQACTGIANQQEKNNSFSLKTLGNGLYQLSFNSSNNLVATVLACDLLGNTLFKHNTTFTSAELLAIDLSSFSSGIYLLKIVSGDEAHAFRLMR